MSNQQSWTAWFLDSYASSISSDYKEDGENPSAESTSPGNTPYVRTGRGGAGNFTWQADGDANDVEAQKPKSLSERRKAAAYLEHIDVGTAMKGRKTSAQYMHMGRGGAGNLSPFNLLQTPRTSASSKSPMSSTTIQSGRGGSGNFAAAAEANNRLESKREEEERIAAERRRELIELEVENVIQPPPGAVLPPRRRSLDELGDD